MGICELFTIIFVAMKLCGAITWSWWVVFFPMYPALLLYAVIFVIVVLCGGTIALDVFKGGK